MMANLWVWVVTMVSVSLAMINRLVVGLTVCFIASPGYALWSGCDYTDFPIMDEMKLFSLIDNGVQNNRPIQVRGFTADASRDQVIQHYHREWEGQVDDSTYGQWDQITTLTDECMMTVQVARVVGGTSEGRLVISNVPTAAANGAVGADLIKPVGSTVISDLRTEDAHKEGRVSVITAPGSSMEVARYYLTQMVNKGWGLERRFNESGGMVLVFRRGLDSTNILLMESPSGTQVLINEELVE